jgi:hypothetical protein
VATFDPVANDNYKNTVNDGAVVIDGVTYAAGTCKLSPITATKQTEKINVNGTQVTVVYYRRTMTIKARHEGWDHLVQDVGVNEKTTVTSTNGPVVQIKPILNSIGVQVKKPWPLDGNGKAKPNVTDTPETLTFKPYTRMSWSGLTFDQ